MISIMGNKGHLKKFNKIAWLRDPRKQDKIYVMDPCAIMFEEIIILEFA